MPGSGPKTPLVPPEKPISIVIPSWNGREILERNVSSVVEALAEYSAGGELIVVDDGSQDGSGQWLASQHPSIRVLARAANEGFGAAANAGAAAARNAHVLLLNNDMTVEQGFLEPLLAPFAGRTDLFATTPRIVNRSFGGDEGVTACRFRYGLFETLFPERGDSPSTAGEGSLDSLRRREGAAAPQGGGIREVLFACGGAALFDRSRWLTLGGFDPLFVPFYWEDVDLSWRARKRGWRIVHVPSSVVYHEHSSTIAARFERRSIGVVFERNRLLFQWKNLTSRRLTARHLAWLPLRIVRSAALRWEFLRGLGMAVRRLGEVLRERRLERVHQRTSDDRILAEFERVD